jgi:hypothetical protein
MTEQNAAKQIHLGFEIGTGVPVSVPLGHLAVTGQTQQSGKTTTLEALIARSGLRAVAFVTKRAEGSFTNSHSIPPFFRDRSDWQFVSDILESKLHEKLKFQRSWIMKVCRGTKSLSEVRQRVQKELAQSKRGLDQSVYTELEAYLDLVIPELEHLPYTTKLELQTGLNVMDLSAYSTSLQMLVISSVMQRVYEGMDNVVTIIPEAWEFVPQKRGSPVMRAAEELIRKSAAAGNFVWLDSQDLAGVHKDILKHCSVWILGVQREENEVQRTLKNVYGVGKNRPKADDIRALGKGEFYACWGREMHHVYVQPEWLDKEVAEQIARREMTIDELRLSAVASHPRARRTTMAKPNEKSQDSLSSLEALELAETYLEDGAPHSALDVIRRALKTLNPSSGAPPDAGAGLVAMAPARSAPVHTSANDDVPGWSEELYQKILSRLVRDVPSNPQILRLMATQPEILVQVKKTTLEIDGQTLKGRLARLIVEGFFQNAATGHAAYQELVKRGASTAKPNVYRGLDELATMGFLLKIPNEGYVAAPGMKVTEKVLEAA